MISDYSYFIVIPIIVILLGIILKSINVNNKIVFLSVLFLLMNLYSSLLLRYQLKDSEYNKDIANFSSVFIAISGIFTYILLSFVPGIKIIIYPLTLLPYSKIWLDLMLIALPMTVLNKIVRFIGEPNVPK